MSLTSLSLEFVVSDLKHYGPFVCGICKGLCSLDVVVTPNDHLYCRDCLKNYLQKEILQHGRALDPVDKTDLRETKTNDTIMVVENVPIRAKSLKIAQSLAYTLLMNVQVKGTRKGSKKEWIGDYKDYHKELNGLLEPPRRLPAPLPKGQRALSVERPSVYDQDDMSTAGRTARGEPTAAHHLRSMPQHSDAASVNLPDIERAMSRCDKLKKQANAKFNRGDIEGARLLYSEGLALIADLPDTNDTVRMMLASLYSNRAVTFFRERILPQSLEDCNKSLELDPNAEKTYIRKWRTLSAMEERDEGITCLQAGLERLPDSHKLQDELRKAMNQPPIGMNHDNSDNQSVSEMTKMSAPPGGWGGPLAGGGEPSPAAIERSERLKKQANAKFNKGEIESARQLYSDALGCIPPAAKYSKELKDSLSMLYSNRAVTFFRDKMFTESLADCEKAIELDPTAEKGYIRKARALMGLERLQEAYDSLHEGTKTLPNSKKIAEEMRKSEFDGYTPSAPKNEPKPSAQKRLSNDYDRPTSASELESSIGSLNYFVSPGTAKLSAGKAKKGADDDFSYELELADKLKRNANAKFNRGDIPGARLLYTEAIGCLPDDTGNEKVRSTLAALYANRAVTFFREKEFGPSTWDCDKAIELDPKSEKSYIRKARALTALSRYDEAIHCLEKGLTVLPASSRLKEELTKCQENGGESYHENKNDGMSVVSGADYMSVSSMGNNTTFIATPKDARSVLGSVAEGAALDVPFSGEEDVERAEKLKKQANAKLNKGDVAGARQLYGQGLEHLPQSSENPQTRELAASLYANRAVTFFREKKFAATVIDCDKSLELDVKHEKSYIRKWRALMALGSFHDAYKCLEDALVAIPGSKRLEEELEAATEQRDLLNNANELIENGDYQGAREAMLPIVNSTDNVSLWLAAARADAYLGITDSAVERVNKVLMFNPNHLEGLQVRAYALFLSGEMEQGMSILKETLEVDIDNTEVSTLLQNCQKIYSNFSKGQARVKRGRYRESVELFTNALESSDTIPIDAPLYSLMLTERAEASLLNNDYDDALEDCAEAIDLKQDNVTAWTVKVEVYFAQGRLQEARDELAGARKSWGAGNDTIEDAYKKTDFELRLQRADDDLRKIAAMVDLGQIPDIPDGDPLHFNMDTVPTKPSSSKSSKRREKSVERRDKSKKSSDRKEHKRKKRSESKNRRKSSIVDKQ